MLTGFWLEKCDSRLAQVSDPTDTSTQYAFLTSRTLTTSCGYDAIYNLPHFKICGCGEQKL